MKKIAIIGAGISGLSMAHFLKDRFIVKVFEKEYRAGGLIKCVKENGSLFHTCGGHVFNSKRQDVLKWFWNQFRQNDEFVKADRNSCIFIDKEESSVEYDKVPYPIENNVYHLSENIQKRFYSDIDEIDRQEKANTNLQDYKNFGDFLRRRFGKTLYGLYFEPYNMKVWRCDLKAIPMSWMEGKLPMPTTTEMRNNNANKVQEKSFVHSTFWYEKNNGSQYIADKLSKGLDIVYNAHINNIKFEDSHWIINDEFFDKVVFCGNIKEMIGIIEGVDLKHYKKDVHDLKYHGTTSVFCEIDANPYSWIYLPSSRYESHRIICTGNFAQSNDGRSIPKGRTTATVEFTDKISKEDIIQNLSKMPLHPLYISHKYNEYTYPIQEGRTRNIIKEIKAELSSKEFYFTGRFADWEYYNMDVAIGAAMDLSKNI